MRYGGLPTLFGRRGVQDIQSVFLDNGMEINGVDKRLKSFNGLECKHDDSSEGS